MRVMMMLMYSNDVDDDNDFMNDDFVVCTACDGWISGDVPETVVVPAGHTPYGCIRLLDRREVHEVPGA